MLSHSISHGSRCLSFLKVMVVRGPSGFTSPRAAGKSFSFCLPQGAANATLLFVSFCLAFLFGLPMFSCGIASCFLYIVARPYMCRIAKAGAVTERSHFPIYVVSRFACEGCETLAWDWELTKSDQKARFRTPCWTATGVTS